MQGELGREVTNVQGELGREVLLLETENIYVKIQTKKGRLNLLYVSW